MEGYKEENKNRLKPKGVHCSNLAGKAEQIYLDSFNSDFITIVTENLNEINAAYKLQEKSPSMIEIRRQDYSCFYHITFNKLCLI